MNIVREDMKKVHGDPIVKSQSRVSSCCLVAIQAMKACLWILPMNKITSCQSTEIFGGFS